MLYGIDLIIVIASVVCAFIAYRKKELSFFVLACLFAFLFENLHVYAFAGREGGYTYATQTIMLLQTPLYVILSWGILLFTSRMLVSTITTKKVHHIFLVPLVTLLVDFALDPFAIRAGLWTWFGYHATEGYFGVPAGNFLAWLIIAWSFMLCFTLIERKWLAFLCSYPLFVVVMNVVSIPKFILHIPKTYELWYMVGIFVLYLLVYRYVAQKWDACREAKAFSSIDIAAVYTLRMLYYIFPLVFLLLLWSQLSLTLILATGFVYGIEALFGVHFFLTLKKDSQKKQTIA